jgi:hypothetical protein
VACHALAVFFMVDSYETWVMIWRCGPAKAHSHFGHKIITNVGGQPFGSLFGTLRPEMKTTKTKNGITLYSGHWLCPKIINTRSPLSKAFM